MAVANHKIKSNKAQKSNNNHTSKLKNLDVKKEDIIHDYRLGYQSRQASLLGRREVMAGKAKFGIFGDGKEVGQLAMARVFEKGDFRSGYYRDQTFMFATGMSNIREFFAQLYAHADVNYESGFGGRAMTCHFATRSLNDDGTWKNLSEMYNSSADISPTAAQMPRLVGLSYASCLYRELRELKHLKQFSKNGNEVAFGTIGNASCAEGIFWETINAIGVLKSPVVLSIWDDDYGISVPNKFQITKSNLFEVLQGFQRTSEDSDGFEISQVRGWDYPELIQTYQKAVKLAREQHIPVIIHVIEVTQPQGHSTSGSHERYKSAERLQWEKEHDCLKKMRHWMLENNIIDAKKLEELEKKDLAAVKSMRDQSWKAFQDPIRKELSEVCELLDELAQQSTHAAEILPIKNKLKTMPNPLRKYLFPAIRQALTIVKDQNLPAVKRLIEWRNRQKTINEDRYSSHLYSESNKSALNVKEIPPVYSEHSKSVAGFEVLNACFDAALASDPKIIAFGEDLGLLGGVNQGFKGMQEKYGKLRVSDTGIRETTIMGQAIGMALRGLRPIAEIQYLDYILFGLQTLSDDLATLLWRTKGGQKAPVIVRTRGHRLEGVWHAGSPMAAMLHLLRGMYILVPRDMTRAAGFYNTLFKSDDPAVIVEVLNGYRLKENLPDNISEFTVPLGIPDILQEGTDVTVVTYGASCRVVLQSAKALKEVDISAEVIDVQTLMPFDIQSVILNSLKKTNRIVFVDEDVPGGTTAYMMQEVLEKQDGYRWLDSKPITIPGKPHRPAYGSDGDYFSKPNVEEIFEAVYSLMHESNPPKWPIYY